jgi:hypothetical protein
LVNQGKMDPRGVIEDKLLNTAFHPYNCIHKVQCALALFHTLFT